MAAEDAAVVVTLRANLKDYETALKSAVRATERAAKSAEQAVSGIGRKAQAAPLAEAFKKSAGQIENDARVMQYQLNDIFTGLATGQGIRAVQQQLGQIAQQLGGGGIVQAARTMGAALMGMVNPINIAVVAFGFAATAATDYFTDSEEGADSSNKALEKQAALLQQVAKAYGDQLPTLKLLADQIERIAKQGDIKSVTAEQVKAQYAPVVAALSVLSAEIVEVTTNLNQMGNSDAADKVNADFAELVKKALAGTAAVADVQKVLDDLGNSNSTNNLLGQLEALRSTIDNAATSSKDLRKEADEALKTVEVDAKQAEVAVTAFLNAFGNTAGVQTIIDMIGTQFPNALLALQNALGGLAGQLSSDWKTVSGSIKNATDMIKHEEGFRANAYWDTNAFRVGFGSDTYVDEMGKVQKVTKDTVVTLDQANQDLTRRISEFQATVMSQIGPDMWKSMSENQQAALSSIAYNYGSLPPAIVKAIKAGDQGQVALAIRNLSANPARRQREADLYAGGNAGAGDAMKVADESAKAAEKEAEARATATKNLAEYLEKLDEQATLEQRIAEIKTSGLTEEEKARAIEVETELQKALNVAKENGLTLSAKEIEAVRAAALAKADATIATAAYTKSQQENAQAIQQFNQQMAQAIGSGLSGFVQDLMAGKDAGDALASAVQRITAQLVDMTLQMLVIKPLMSALGGLGGVGGVGAGWAGGATQFAAGGTVGLSHHQDGRKHPSALWAGAPHMASGGVILGPNAVPIIAHRGEVIVPNARRLAGNAAGGTVHNTYSLEGPVNIDMAGTGLVAANNDDAKEFGKNVQKLIQAEMVRESRPGGLLRKAN